LILFCKNREGRRYWATSSASNSRCSNLRGTTNQCTQSINEARLANISVTNYMNMFVAFVGLSQMREQQGNTFAGYGRDWNHGAMQSPAKPFDAALAMSWRQQVHLVQYNNWVEFLKKYRAGHIKCVHHQKNKAAVNKVFVRVVDGGIF
jgi:hypothetical protein